MEHNSMLEQVGQTVARYQMLEPGEEVLVALSGGADSVAMLLCLRELGYPVCAFHLNHGLRGDEAARDEDFVRSLCAELGVPLTVAREDIAALAAKRKESIETAARVRRYQLLQEHAGGRKIATAHTADDNIETVLFHLTRGTGAKGMAGIPPVRGAIIRPMLETSRAEIETYLEEIGQAFVVDSTNLTADCTRNRIRHEVVPVLRQINPDLGEAVGRLTRLIRQDDAYLDAQAETLLQESRQEDGCQIQPLREAPPPLSSRALRLLLSQSGVPCAQIGERHILLLEELLASENPSASLDLPNGYSARRSYAKLRIMREEPVLLWPEQRLTVPFDGPVGPDGIRLTLKLSEKNQVFYKSFNTFSVDCGKIDIETLTVRARQPGDRLRLTEKGGSRTLKKLMIDRHIPRFDRARLAVIADKHGVIAVQGLGADQSRMGTDGKAVEIHFEGK